MMDLFLKAKHWQIFTLLIGVPIVMQIIVATTMITTHAPDLMFSIMPVYSILYIVIFFGWFWAIGTRLHHRLPENVKINLKLFKAFLTVPIIYTVGISIYMNMVASGLIESERSPAFAMLDIMNMIFLVHIFSMFCIFYAMWFNAKTIKSIEFQRPVKFADFAGEFFLLWLFPVGIWIIQPKINKMIKENKAHTANKGA